MKEIIYEDETDKIVKEVYLIKWNLIYLMMKKEPMVLDID